MKRLDAANDNDAGKQVECTRQIWEPRTDRVLTDEEARQIHHSVIGFFRVLAEWQHAEMIVAANDGAPVIEPNDGKVIHDR